MADTPYTEGFKAGMAWREAEIIKQLGQTQSPPRFWGGIAWAIAVIKGEK